MHPVLIICGQYEEAILVFIWDGVMAQLMENAESGVAYSER